MNNDTARAAEAKQPTSCMVFRRDLKFVPQKGRGAWRVIIEDARNRKFYRLGRREYLIASFLDGKQDLASAVSNLNATQPDYAIDGATLEQTLKWFMSNGLTQIVSLDKSSDKSECISDAAKSDQPSSINETSLAKTAAAPATNNSCIDPFSFRIPILSGELLTGCAKHVSWIASAPVAIASALVILFAIINFVANAQQLTQLSATLFVPQATLWWFFAWIILKAVHEIGHAVVCVAMGGEVRGAGIAFFYMAPVPYVDTTDMWRLSDRKSRAYCAAGGMWFELVLASIALLICRWTDNPSLQYLSISIATLGTFTTVAFNANPLVRFDGYYILSDLLDRPNLYNEGQAASQSVWQNSTWLFSSAVSVHGLSLVIYGFGCMLNRILMMVGMAWGAWLTWRGIGLGIIGLATYLWFISPALKRSKMRAMQALAAGQPVKKFQWKALPGKKIAICSGVLAGCVVAAILVPSPLQPVSPGVLTNGEPVVLRSAADGFIAEVYVEDHQQVNQGDPIYRIENPMLVMEIAKAKVQLESNRQKCLVLRAQGKIAEMQAAESQVAAIQEQLDQLEERGEKLVVTAPISGMLVARKLSDSLGMYLKPGQPMGTIEGFKSLHVSCSIDQTDLDRFQKSPHGKVAVFLEGFGRAEGRIVELRPRGADTLEHPALAAKFGGPISVHMATNSDGKNDSLRTQSPRFDVRIELSSIPDDAIGVVPGQLCRVELIDNSVSIAGIASRWKDAFIDYVKPDIEN